MGQFPLYPNAVTTSVNTTPGPLAAVPVPRTGNNVGQDTNNPGNIMAENPAGEAYAKSLGAIGKYTSPNGRTYAVFPNMLVG